MEAKCRGSHYCTWSGAVLKICLIVWGRKEGSKQQKLKSDLRQTFWQITSSWIRRAPTLTRVRSPAQGLSRKFQNVKGPLETSEANGVGLGCCWVLLATAVISSSETSGWKTAGEEWWRFTIPPQSASTNSANNKLLQKHFSSSFKSAVLQGDNYTPAAAQREAQRRSELWYRHVCQVF